MKKNTFKIFSSFYLFFLRRRYRITVKNLDLLESAYPLLILPNHQAFVDPQILFSYIFKVHSASSIVAEYMYNTPILHSLLKIMGSVPVPDYSEIDKKHTDPKQMHKNILSHLESGKSIVIYPSGQTQGQGYEVINGKQSAHYIVSNMPPDTRVIGVRISGLWGSLWSRAWNGKGINLFTVFPRSVFYIFANLIFFVPKRDVSLSFYDITDNAKKNAHKSLFEFNRYLEEFYNKHGKEKVRYIKHFFFVPQFKKELPKHIEGSVDDFSCVHGACEVLVKDTTRDFVFDKIVNINNTIQKNTLTLDKSLALDLQMDSLQIAELVSIVQMHFPESSHPRYEKLKTVLDICAMAEGKSDAREPLPKCTFAQDKNLPKDTLTIDNSIHDIRKLFIKTFTHKSGTFTYDKLRGSTSYKSFLTRASVASLIIKKITKNERIGIMLPALQSTTLLIAATYLARKTPVMFNWTSGKRAFLHCVNTSNTKKILTARAFFDRVRDDIPDELLDRFVFLDDELAKLSIFTKARGALLAKIPKLLTLGKLPKTAVILFTSGSESLPKPVPLTHNNIISNITGSLTLFNITQDNILLGKLPAFHSTGFTATVIMPLITGLRTAYSPDPTDSFSIAKIIAHTKTTILGTAPTFLNMLLRDTELKQLTSLRYIITGAEALLQSIHTSTSSSLPDTRILEAYGVTECSPIIAFSPTRTPKQGSVGKIIPTLEYTIRNLDTGKECALGESGMIYVRGASVFNGYLDKELASPFETIDGKEFYKTGDLGYIDKDDYLFITGRLKRFIKTGGEMISLPMIENTLLKKYGNDEETVLAVEGKEDNGKICITCFTTIDIDVTEANQILKDAGIPNIAKIHDVKKVDEIPLLGSGKTDYKVLKAQM